MKFPRVAEALRAVRQSTGLSQEKFARRLGFAFSSYRPYERGDRDPTYSQITRFSEALDLPVSEFTRRLWPDDVRIVETRYAADFADLQRQVAGLPPELQEQVLRGFQQSLEIAHAADPLARRN